MVQNKSVATAWLCLGRGGAHTGDPTNISHSGHQGLMSEGQALWSRMSTSSPPSSLLYRLGKSMFWSPVETQMGGWALQFCYSKSVLGPATWVSPGSLIEMQKHGAHPSPAESGPLGDFYAHYNFRSSALGNNILGPLTILAHIVGLCLPCLLISYNHNLEWTYFISLWILSRVFLDRTKSSS